MCCLGEIFSDADSFHPSLWEEERLKKQTIHFENANAEIEEEVRPNMQQINFGRYKVM